MKVFYQKVIVDRFGQKVPMYAFSTETSDEVLYNGKTLDEALANFTKHTGITPTELVNMDKLFTK